MSVFGGVVFRSGIVAHALGIFLHIVHLLVRDDAAGFYFLPNMIGEIDGIVGVNFPCATVGRGQEIFVAATGFGEASGDVANFALGIGVGVILGGGPERRQTSDGACERMRGADGNAGEGGSEKRNRTGAFGAESTERLELRDLLAHGMDDAPSAEVSAGSDGSVGRKDDGPVIASPVAEHVGF